MPPEIVIVQPFDFVGSVVVPGVAILVSAALAIWIASAERRSAVRSRIQAETAAMIEAVTRLGFAATAPVNATEFREASVSFAQQSLIFAAHLPSRDLPVAKWAIIMMGRALATRQHVIAAKAALFVQNGLDEWLRGKARTRDFVRNMPADVHGMWTDSFDASKWMDTLTTGPSA